MTTVKDILNSQTKGTCIISREEFMRYFSSIHKFICDNGFNGSTVVKHCIIEDHADKDLITVSLFFMYGPHILHNSDNPPKDVKLSDLSDCTSNSNSFAWYFTIRKSTGRAVSKELSDFTLFRKTPVWSPINACPDINQVKASALIKAVSETINKLNQLGKDIHSVEFNYVCNEENIPENDIPFGYFKGCGYREVYGSATNSPDSGIGAWYLGVDLRNFTGFNTCNYEVESYPCVIGGNKEYKLKFNINSLKCRGYEAFGVPFK